VANKDLSVHLSLRIARAAATVLRRHGDQRPLVVVGRDTRLSGDMIEAALIAGFCSAGADVIPVGVIPTAGVAYLARTIDDAEIGAVISASHNPFQDNGIKFFSHAGFKLADEIEREIEERVASDEHMDHPQGEGVGRRLEVPDAVQRYVDYLRGLAPGGLSGLKLVADCANGAASHIAPRLLRELGAEVITICAEPNGTNINAGCGATHPEVVGRAVVEHGADAGLSFDGDADRLMLADEHGRVVNGDYIMAMIGRALHAEGRLPGGIIVGTVMSNLGLERGLEQMGMRLVRANVGDRYVLEEMQKLGASLGGEQSGHLIFLEHATTGDGLVTALLAMRLLKQSGEKLSTLASIISDYPQKLVNITVGSVKGWDGHPAIMSAITEAEQDLGANGRILVRASGTEPKIRVMVEALKHEQVERWTSHVAGVIERQLT
jgi:phosphoglucosamine mutase